MEKLELKHLAPYLPYGLKGIITSDKRDDFCHEDWFDEDKFKSKAIWEYCGYAPSDLSIPLGEGEFNGFLLRNGDTYVCFNHGIKPILHQLSYLTKEIDCPEVMGERIVPYIELLRECNFNVDNMSKEEIEYYKHKESEIDTFSMMFLEVQKLFEWHFDVFGLIEKGLAIDINTL